MNQIRLWVRQGRTDAWIAHTLDISIGDLTRFKREHDLVGEETSTLRPADPLSVPPPEPSAEVDEDEEDEDEDSDERPRRESRSRSRSRRRTRPREEREERGEEEAEEEYESRAGEEGRRDDADGDEAPRRRRRGRRGGRRHRARRNALEATFDHGEEGYGLWLDPAVVDNPVYAEHWAGHRAVTVTLDADTITIRRAPQQREPDAPEDDEVE
jgi:hypothetical protein